jgi:hypothetical protein
MFYYVEIFLWRIVFDEVWLELLFKGETVLKDTNQNKTYLIAWILDTNTKFNRNMFSILEMETCELRTHVTIHL